MHDTESKTENLEREVFALGIQLAAARERLALALRVVEMARRIGSPWGRIDSAWAFRDLHDLQDALAAFDAVPGDARKP
jgi:hypothetical protein